MQRIIYALALFLLALGALQAQDPRFSQFYAAPLQLNPAMIGVSPGKVRFGVNYREQYNSILGQYPYRTMGVGFDMRFRAIQRDYLALGVTLQRDQAGEDRFNRTTGSLGLSFMKQLGGSRYAASDQYLVAGAQVGFEQRSFDGRSLWFSTQFDEPSASINYDSPSGEPIEDYNRQLFLDFNAGLLWYALFDDNMSIYAGGAVHHITTPMISFIEESPDRLYRRWTAHTGGEVPFTKELSLLPAVVFTAQGPARSFAFGANLRYTNREWKEVALRAGAWGHISNRDQQGIHSDAVAVTAVLELERWNLGISYDLTASSLAAANNGRGALEFSLVYIYPEKSRYRVNCPKL